MQIPLDADPPDAGHVTCDACWEANPPMIRMTHICKNITLPQTSFNFSLQKIYVSQTMPCHCLPSADIPLGRPPSKADIPLGRCSLGRHPPRQTPLWADTPPPPPPGDGHCSGRYASYWSASLFYTESMNRF